MKKTISFILAAIMMLSLVACGGPSGPVNPTTPKDPVVNYVPTYPIVDEKLVLQGVTYGADPNKAGENNRSVWAEIEKYTNIKIEWTVLETEEALTTYLAGNEWPDIIHTKAQLKDSIINDYGVIGHRFVDWTQYLDVMPNLKKALEDYPEALAKETLLNGEAYGLPRMNGASATGVVARPYIRTDVLQKAGITTMPKTTEEFYNCLKTLYAYYGEPGLIMDKAVNTSWAPLLFAAFGTYTRIGFDDNGSGEVVHTYSSEQMKEYYKFMNKLYEENLLHKEFLTMKNTAKAGLVCKVDSAVAFLPSAAAQGLQAEHLTDGNWDYLTCLAPLTSSFDNTQTLAGRYSLGAASIYVSAQSKHVDEIMKMLDVSYATEEVVEGSGLYGMSFGYGSEGIGWTWNEDGTYTQSDGKAFGWNSYTELQTMELIYYSTGRLDAWGVQATTAIGNARARQLGFIDAVLPYQVTENLFDESMLKFTDDEQMILDQYLTEIQTYDSEMYAAFITGNKDIDAEWNNYVNTLKKMGIEDVIEVYQAAYDRWNTALESSK